MTDEYDAVVEQLAQMGYRFGPAAEQDLHRLESLRLPEFVTKFYRRYEPVRVQRTLPLILHSIEDIVVENFHASPGIEVCRFGYVVFASSPFGEGYCFDLNTGEVPQVVQFDSSDSFVSLAEAQKGAVYIAGSLLEFLADTVRNG